MPAEATSTLLATSSIIISVLGGAAALWDRFATKEQKTGKDDITVSGLSTRVLKLEGDSEQQDKRIAELAQQVFVKSQLDLRAEAAAKELLVKVDSIQNDLNRIKGKFDIH